MNKNKKGYLVFTTHDMDEVDATFVPEDHAEILKCLRTQDDPMIAFSEWQEKFHKEPWYKKWWTQTNCEMEWPFNSYNILGTFHHIVY